MHTTKSVFETKDIENDVACKEKVADLKLKGIQEDMEGEDEHQLKDLEKCMTCLTPGTNSPTEIERNFVLNS